MEDFSFSEVTCKCVVKLVQVIIIEYRALDQIAKFHEKCDSFDHLWWDMAHDGREINLVCYQQERNSRNIKRTLVLWFSAATCAAVC